MGSNHHPCGVKLFLVVLLCASFNSSATGIQANQSAWLSVDASETSARKIPKTMFGISFEVSPTNGIVWFCAQHFPSRIIMKSKSILLLTQF